MKAKFLLAAILMLALSIGAANANPISTGTSTAMHANHASAPVHHRHHRHHHHHMMHH